MKKRNLIAEIIFVVAVVAVATIALIGLLSTHPTPPTLQGTVECRSVRIAGKLPGRVERLYVAEGEMVTTGDTLISIHSPEAEAKYTQAHSMEEAAKAQSRKIDGGTRSEVIASAEQMWRAAKAQLRLAKQTYERLERLFADSVVTLQRKEEAEALYLTAKANEKAASQQYRMARKGAQKEDIASARYVADAAGGTTEEVEAVLMDAHLLAPICGMVSEVYVEEGELVGTGTPLLSIVELAEPYVVLNVREELMPHFALGGEFAGSVPALGGEMVVWSIYYISPLGSYTTWQTSSPQGSYDMRTFEVHARPISLLEGRLLPGMSVIVELETVMQ